SRRRHTRFDCDWSSDVCSSDLKKLCNLVPGFDAAIDSCDRDVANRNPCLSERQIVKIDSRRTCVHTGIHTRTLKSQILDDDVGRSEEHTSELQSQSNLVCRLLL